LRLGDFASNNSLSTSIFFLILFVWYPLSNAAEPLKPIPDRLVVLTFDDGNKSDIETVAPLLAKYGFGATFFVTEGLGADKDKTNFLTWEEIEQLNKLGFEIGNHTRRHINVTKQPRDQLAADVAYIEEQCQARGIPRPRSFAFPGNHYNDQAVEVLKQRGYQFARRGFEPEKREQLEGGRGVAYDPAAHHPLRIPTTGAPGPKFTFDDLVWSVDQAQEGRICVLTFHGIPAKLHPWVNVAPAEFERYLRYLKQRDCQVIAMRELSRYVDPTRMPAEAKP
jgi:peptidoglycan/xylan/chitin deacetylase (PgdA/CDA1 family)